MTELNEAIVNLDFSEAYGLAIKVEEDGFALYEKAIEMTDNPRAKEDLAFLRDQEKGHRTYFEKLLKSTIKGYIADSGSALYLWVKENLFVPVQDALKKITPQTYQDSLSIGIDIEEKSIQLYKELKKAINKIIKEEQRHKKFLKIVLKYST